MQEQGRDTRLISTSHKDLKTVTSRHYKAQYMICSISIAEAARHDRRRRRRRRHGLHRVVEQGSS